MACDHRWLVGRGAPAAPASRVPMNQQKSNFESGQIAVHVHKAPQPRSFCFGPAILSRQPHIAQISSHWTRLQVRSRNTRSWYSEHARPIQTSRRDTVFLVTPQRRAVARTPFPSHRQAMIWERFSLLIKLAMVGCGSSFSHRHRGCALASPVGFQPTPFPLRGGCSMR